MIFFQFFMTKKGGALIEGLITVGQATMEVELISNVAWDWGTEGGKSGDMQSTRPT